MKRTVLFLSAMESLEDIQQGYEAGGVDYVTKPYRPAELRLKVSQIVAASKEQNKYKQKATNAKSVALEAMSETEHLGQALEFMKAAIGIRNERQLGELVLKAFEKLDLQVI